MKLKYSASLALALWLGVVAWVSAMIVAKPSVTRAYADGDDSATIAQLQLDINRNRQLLASLDALASSNGYGGDGPVVAPGSAATASIDPATGEPGATVVSHTLSLILSSDRGRRALVDGQWASPGSRLADGSRVRAIGASHVLLEDPAGQRLELRMPAPFADADAGADAGSGVTEVLR